MAETPASVNYNALFRTLPGSYLLLAPDGTVLDNSDQHMATRYQRGQIKEARTAPTRLTPSPTKLRPS